MQIIEDDDDNDDEEDDFKIQTKINTKNNKYSRLKPIVEDDSVNETKIDINKQNQHKQPQKNRIDDDDDDDEIQFLESLYNKNILKKEECVIVNEPSVCKPNNNINNSTKTASFDDKNSNKLNFSNQKTTTCSSLVNDKSSSKIEPVLEDVSMNLAKPVSFF